MSPVSRVLEGSPLVGSRRTIAIACVLSALVLVVLDAAIANVALPAMARALAVSPARAVRVVTAYQLALVMALLPASALGESLGYRRVHRAGVALFTGASVFCALAPTLEWLLVARFVQGLGGAAIMSLGVALLRSVVAPRELGAVVGWNALAVALGAAAGPTIGALILASAGWPWLFAVNLPLGVLVLVATRALPDLPGSARPLDLASVAIDVGAFAALILGAELLSERPSLGFALLVVAALLFVALVRREMPRAAPLIPLDLLRGRSFRVSVLASIAFFVGQSAAMVSLPFHLHHGSNASWAGLLITPWPLTVAAVAPLAGRLAERVSGAVLCAVGGMLLSLGLSAAALWPMHDRPLVVLPFLVVCGAGFGLFQVSNNRNMFLSAPRERSGAAGGAQGTARLTGQTLGGVLMTLLFAVYSVERAPRAGLLVAAALTSIAGMVHLLAGRDAHPPPSGDP